jgi:hypothetical protein
MADAGEEVFWVATLDKATGKYYYYNKKTRVTTWTRPPGVKDPDRCARPRGPSHAGL